jgi:hypothetical protein
MQPLVRSERVLFQATRDPAPAQPPRLWPGLLALGVAAGALILWSGSRGNASASRSGRIAPAIVIGVWSVATGLLGLVLTLLWTATDHVFAHRNENLLLFNPLWLVAAVLVPMAYGRGGAIRAARAISIVIAVLAAVAVVLHVTTLSAQKNWAEIGLGLPPALALAWVMTRRAAEARV